MSTEIQKIISDNLDEIEKTENVKILHCVESGSRAWGFASPDSDYDVRFIYVRPKEYYLRLDKTRDVIEWKLDEVLDINGWDLQKALRLLHKSNPTLFEWNNSPIVYRTTPEWNEIRQIIDKYLNRKSALYHYISTAKTNYREYLKTDDVRLKKYFYAIRPILACRWIIDKKCPPPVLFSQLAESELDPAVKPYVDILLDMKINSPEVATGKRIDELNEYIERNIAEIDRMICETDKDTTADWNELNSIFLKILSY
jgi:hypothetical protein